MISAVDGFLSVMVVGWHDDGRTSTLTHTGWGSLRGTRIEFAQCTETQTELAEPVNIARIMAGVPEGDNLTHEPPRGILTLKKPFGLEPICHGVYDLIPPPVSPRCEVFAAEH